MNMDERALKSLKATEKRHTILDWKLECRVRF